jgi:hypothetical protein
MVWIDLDGLPTRERELEDVAEIMRGTDVNAVRASRPGHHPLPLLLAASMRRMRW